MIRLLLDNQRCIARMEESIGNFTNGGFKYNNYYPMHSVASLKEEYHQ